jgi:hypothetical protein
MKHQIIKIHFLYCVLGFCLLVFVAPIQAGGTEPIKVEILYMNHGPLRPTIRNLQELFSHYQGKVNVSWYDEDRKEGKDFEKDKGIQGHIPLLILIKGKKDFIREGKTIIFEGFPSGSGPFKEVEGNWSIADLQRLLDSLTR